MGAKQRVVGAITLALTQALTIHGTGVDTRVRLLLTPVSAAEAASVSEPQQTIDLLIEKFTRVYLNLSPRDSSRVAVTLRLADLLSERARQAALKELAAGCIVCQAGQADREKALVYYQEVLPKAPAQIRGKVLSQVGHLYELTGQEAQAAGTYQTIIAEEQAPESLHEANLSLGEMYFKRRDFATARGYYQAVLAGAHPVNRGLAAYRLAWCEFNAGAVSSAIEGLVKILQSPELLTRNGVAGIIQIDRQFQEEASRDLATFMARQIVEKGEAVKNAELLHSLSPDSVKTANLSYLSTELERLGQIESAIVLWKFTKERQSQPLERLESHVRLAQLQMDHRRIAEALADYEASLRLWAETGGCSALSPIVKSTDGSGPSGCRELKTRLRKFVLDWNRKETSVFSQELLKAYQVYLQVFPQEADMALWAAKGASDLKKYSLALELYQRGAVLSDQELQAKSSNPEVTKRLEAGLLGMIEASEILEQDGKDSSKRELAYATYLQLSREKKRALEVDYQKAHLVYDRGDYQSASEALNRIALLRPEIASPLLKQAADLSLDALVFLKDDVKIEQWAKSYAERFPEQRAEFLAVARKSVLSQVVSLASQGGAGLEAATQALNRFELTNASPEEKVSYHKNRLILAEKRERYSEARDAVENLLKISQLSESDRQYALSRQAWLAELIFDFDSALTATQKMSEASIAGEQKWLKLAMFAELAAKDPKPFYTEYLKLSRDQDKRVAIAAQIVRQAKDPLKELEVQSKILLQAPEVMSHLYLEQVGRTSKGRLDVAKRVLKLPQLAKTAAGKVLQRMLFLEDYALLVGKIKTHQLDGSAQRKMAATLKARTALLAEVEKLAARAVSHEDWTSQVVSLHLLALESERFYQEIFGLPIPQGLSPEEEQEYLTLLSQSASPHKVRANDVKAKLSEFWNSTNAIVQLERSLQEQSGSLREIVKQEISALAQVAPEEKKVQLGALVSLEEKFNDRPSMAELEKARQAVRENPMNRSLLEALLLLERRSGQTAMVSYLEQRLGSLAGPVEKKAIE